MSNEIALNKPNYLVPQTFEQAERYAEKIAASSLCPTAFKNKAGDILIAMQMGAEVGLSPMQAIQNIAVIQGRPSLWGDAAIGVVRCHPHCQSIREWVEGTVEALDATAYCAVTRKGQTEEVRKFSIADAKKANLWGKAGTWTQYPLRMLQMRARGFAIRDVFPDALRGLHIAEESQDIIDVTPITEATIQHHKQFEGQPLSQSFTCDSEILEQYICGIESSMTKALLQEIYKEAKEATKGDKIASNKISIATKKRLAELQKEIDDAAQPKQPTTDEWKDAYDKAETV